MYRIPWVKVIERGGTKLKDLITNKSPWRKVYCGRPDCLTCHSFLDQPETSPKQYKAGLGSCYNRNVCYKLTCVSCLKKVIRTSYVGETSRSLYERVGEHLKGLKTAIMRGSSNSEMRKSSRKKELGGQ